MKVALIQLCSSDDPQENVAKILAQIEAAAKAGARLVCTPEVSNCVSLNRDHQERVLAYQADDRGLAKLQAAACRLKVHVAIGSFALKGGVDGRFVNRSFVLAPNGDIIAHYDKIHMFDVQVTETETYNESSGYAPGDRAVVADIGGATLGLTICYDLRFPYLYRALAKAGADILLVPSAFSPVTGAAHWEPLLRARAIETGCFVVAAAQSGLHPAKSGRRRETYGRSLVVSPWGEVLADAGTDCGITHIDLDLSEVSKSRQRLPSLWHDKTFDGP